MGWGSDDALDKVRCRMRSEFGIRIGTRGRETADAVLVIAFPPLGQTIGAGW